MGEMNAKKLQPDDRQGRGCSIELDRHFPLAGVADAVDASGTQDALLLADIGLGFLARTVPQMNIFVLGLPMKVALGLFVLTVALPLMVDTVYDQLERWIEFALQSATAWR